MSLSKETVQRPFGVIVALTPVEPRTQGWTACMIHLGCDLVILYLLDRQCP